MLIVRSAGEDLPCSLWNNIVQFTELIEVFITVVRGFGGADTWQCLRQPVVLRVAGPIEGRAFCAVLSSVFESRIRQRLKVVRCTLSLRGATSIKKQKKQNECECFRKYHWITFYTEWIPFSGSE